MATAPPTFQKEATMIHANEYRTGRYILLRDDPPAMIAFNVSREDAQDVLFELLPAVEAMEVLNNPDLSSEGIARYRGAFAAAMTAEVQRAGVSIEELTGEILQLQERAATAEQRSDGLAHALENLQKQASERDRKDRISRELSKRLEVIAQLEQMTVDEAREQFGVAVQRVLEETSPA